MSDCPVCYEQLTEENQVVLCANEHKICRECLQGMIRSNRSPKCPMDRGDIIWANVPEDLRPVRRDDRVRERRGGPVDIPALRQQLVTAVDRRAEALILQAELQAQQARIARQLADVNELVANMGEVIRVRTDQINTARQRQEALEQLEIAHEPNIFEQERANFRERQRAEGHFAQREVVGRDEVRRNVVPRELEHVYGTQNISGSGRFVVNGVPTFTPARVVGGRRCGNCRYFGHTRGRCPYDSDNTGGMWSHDHSESIGIRDAYVAGVALLN